VPLLLQQLPSPKDFRDAISSLSSEQKRFAMSFREMQLEGSVFAVCCIRLKPQLEALLRLPSNALTKEIQLMQDLMSLFVDYQIPSDLLSFDGPEDVSVATKVNIVRGHVGSVMAVVGEVKERELEAVQKAAFGSKQLHRLAAASKDTNQQAILPDNKLRCVLVFRLEAGPPESPTLLAKCEHAPQSDAHSATSAVAGALCGARNQNCADAVSMVVTNDPPVQARDPGGLGSFKMVQSATHRIMYGADTDGLCLAVLTGLQYPSRKAVRMLAELYGHYSEQFDLRAKSAATDSLIRNSTPKLAAMCKIYDDHGDVDRAQSLIDKVDDVKAQMQDNIAAILTNTEQAESLAERSDALTEQASVFKKNSTDLRRQMRYKQMGLAPVMKLGRMVAGQSRHRQTPSVARPAADKVLHQSASLTGKQHAPDPTMLPHQTAVLDNLDRAAARVGQMATDINEELGQQNKLTRDLASAGEKPKSSGSCASQTDDATTRIEESRFEAAPSSTSNGKIDAESKTSGGTEDRKTAGARAAEDPRGLVDFTQIPKMLDAKFGELDNENALRATTVATGDVWIKKYRRSVLAKTTKSVLRKDDRRSERERALDLLDALSRSGSLPLEWAELHVIVAATHNFNLGLMDTVICDNVNPIEKMERSTLLVASTIHNKDPVELLRDDGQIGRAKQFHPDLFRR